MTDQKASKISDRDPEAVIRVRDFSLRKDISLEIHSDRVSPDDILVRGRRQRRELRPGLFLQTGDTFEETAFTTHSHQPAGLTCIFFLHGQVETQFGDRLFHFKAGANGQVAAAAVARREAESFRRTAKGPQRTQYLVLTATAEWLDFHGSEQRGNPLGTRLGGRRIESYQWEQTPGLVRRLRELFEPPAYSPELLRLHQESRAVELMLEAVSGMTGENRRGDGNVLKRCDRVRLQRARELMISAPGRLLSVDDIAREAGVSASGLQRLFRRAEGMSVFGYLRRVRLEQALAALQRDSVSVQRASDMAGYTSPANFATAFKRQFGFTPREAGKKRLPHRNSPTDPQPE